MSFFLQLLQRQALEDIHKSSFHLVVDTNPLLEYMGYSCTLSFSQAKAHAAIAVVSYLKLSRATCKKLRTDVLRDAH
jgi:hypothetical protein